MQPANRNSKPPSSLSAPPARNRDAFLAGLAHRAPAKLLARIISGVDLPSSFLHLRSKIQGRGIHSFTERDPRPVFLGATYAKSKCNTSALSTPVSSTAFSPEMAAPSPA